MENLTVQQEQRALQALKKIVKKSKDMLPDVNLVLHQSSGGSGYHKELIVNRSGLVHQEGYYHFCGTDCIDSNHEGTLERKKLTPSVEVIRKFKLTAKELEKQFRKLTE